jgi:intein/homing endonuclease
MAKVKKVKKTTEATREVSNAFWPIVGQDMSNVEEQTIARFSEDALLVYGSYVVEERAIADYRDGFKPSHRAVLWSLCGLGLRPSSGFKKAARTVGDAIGKYHPHGDSGTYGAMVTIANTIPPIVDGQGNWGTPVDNAAAYRYCFTASARVMTHEGLIRIADIPEKFAGNKHAKHNDGEKVKFKTNDLICSSLNDPKPVSHWIHSGVQDTLRVTTNLGNSVTCTPNEPFYVLHGSEFVWKLASDLLPGDRVCLKLESKLDPTGGKALPKFAHVSKAHNSVSYDETCFPKSMSEDLAYVLGCWVSEGSSRKQHGVGFCNTSRAYYSAFKTAFDKLFTVETSERLREPVSYGKKKFMQHTAKYSVMNTWTKNVGVRWGSRNQVVPDCIFQSSKSEVSSFLSSLFEGDGTICGDRLELISTSSKLLKGVQTLLLGYFGVYSVIRSDRLRISGSENLLKLDNVITFVSPIKNKSLQRLFASRSEMLHSTNCGGGYELNNIPKSTCVAIREEFKQYRLGIRKFITENEEVIDLHGSRFVEKSELSGFTNLFNMRHVNIRRIKNEWVKYGHIAEQYWPTLAAKIKALLDNYFFAEVKSITAGKKQPVYDLTVPDTHAFTANGFVVHNTEAKMSKFAHMFIADPKYLEVATKVPNFSNDDTIPLFMPALLPYLLFNGSIPAPAYGVRAGNPSFSFESVAQVVCEMLSGEVYDAKRLAKVLKIQHAFGCESITDKKDYAEFIRTGRGNIEYAPLVAHDYKKRLIQIRSFCPVTLASDNAIEKSLMKIRQIQGVRIAYNAQGKKSKGSGPYGALFNIEVQKSISEDRFDEVLEAIDNIICSRVNYRLGVTIRKADESNAFKYINFEQFFKSWIKYRIALEVRMINQLLKTAERDLHINEVYLFAVQNMEKLLKALPKVLVAKDPDAALAKVLNIPVEDATIILDRKVRQLAKLEEADLLAKIKELKREIATLRTDLKNPGARASRDTTERVEKYLRNPDTLPSGTVIGGKKK